MWNALWQQADTHTHTQLSERDSVYVLTWYAQFSLSRVRSCSSCLHCENTIQINTPGLVQVVSGLVGVNCVNSCCHSDNKEDSNDFLTVLKTPDGSTCLQHLSVFLLVLTLYVLFYDHIHWANNDNMWSTYDWSLIQEGHFRIVFFADTASWQTLRGVLALCGLSSQTRFFTNVRFNKMDELGLQVGTTLTMIVMSCWSLWQVCRQE